MKLAEPIANSAGITLMPAGIRLTPMFIVRLKKWNIDTVEVFAEAAPKGKTEVVAATRAAPKSSTSTAGISAEQGEFARSIASDVSRWFMNVRENPLMMQLRNVVIKRLVAHGKTGMINIMRRPPESGEGEGTA